ncbi:MAG: hypothetical protein HY074_02335 [Deltaproteobacteria bacterium]|nr:hypothetical protein [Deltaproteobacteria bacterium]
MHFSETPPVDEVEAYYQRAAQWLLPFLSGRTAFYSRVPGAAFERMDGPPPPDAVELRVANIRTRTPLRPDWLALRLRSATQPCWNLCAAAEATQQLLTELGFEFFWKVSGTGGLHVLLPVQARYGFGAVADFARMLAEIVVSRVPGAATTQRQPGSRRVCIDAVANGRDVMLLPPLSVRAQMPARISLPLAWGQLHQALSRTGSCPEFDLTISPELLSMGGILAQRALLNPNDLEPGFIALESALQSAS